MGRMIVLLVATCRRVKMMININHYLKLDYSEKMKFCIIIEYKIYINMKKSFLSLLLLTFFLLTALVEGQCDAPKGFFMSFKSMGKRDTIQNLFTEVNEVISTYNSTYTD